MRIVDNEMKDIISELSLNIDIDNAKLHFKEALNQINEFSEYEKCMTRRQSCIGGKCLPGITRY